MLRVGRDLEPVRDLIDLDNADLAEFLLFDLKPSRINLRRILLTLSGLISPGSSNKDSLWDWRDNSLNTPTQLLF